VGEAEKAAAANPAGHVINSNEPPPPLILVPGTRDHRVMIRALSALAAIAITFLMLWWMERP
jgi:hypothetical protein